MKQQKGMTLIGTIFVLVVVGFVVVMAFKMVPAYIEYWSIRKVLTTMANQPDFQTSTVGELRAGFDRRAIIDNITVIKGSDLEITKEDGSPVVTAEYSVKVPLVANVSACVDFVASTSKSR